MKRLILILNGKGGVGKTSSAVNLAYISASKGYRTLVWDLDPQGATSFYFRIKPKVKGGPKPKPDFSAAASHDAAHVLIETLRRAGDAEGYRQFPIALPTAGVTGVLHFDSSGNRTDALQVLACQQGRFDPIPPTKP